jgi:transcriptional regulator with XRE-family HTH domain
MKRGTRGAWSAKYDWVETSVGANVRAFRVKAQMTQQQLADAVGLEIKSLQRVEAGYGNVTSRVFFVLCEALGVDPKALFQPAELKPRKRGRPPKNPVD